MKFTPEAALAIFATGNGAHHGLNIWDWQESGQIRGGFPKGGLIDYQINPDDKKWNDGGQRGCGVTKDGVLLTMTRGRELRLWFDEPRKESKPEKK